MSVIETVRLVLEEYEIGEPWKLTKGAGFVIPILGRPPFPDRNYVLLQEVLDDVTFKDTGGIGGVDVSNRSGRPVFVRKGTMLKGMGTQSRSPVAGVVLEPEAKPVKIPVDCIHASHGIRAGASFIAMGVTPHSVYSDLGLQSATWASISDYSARARAGGSRVGGRAASAMASMSHDALIDVEESVGKFRDEVDNLLKQIPGDHVNQLGIAVFDLKGVAGVEVFDHPDSWHAFSESITRSYSELLTEEVSDIYEIRMDRAEPVLRDFLKKASNAERNLVTENKVSKVWALSAEDIDGELAEVEGREIHLVLSRSRERRQPQTPQQTSQWADRWRRTTQRPRQTPRKTTEKEVAPLFTSVMRSPGWYRRRGSRDLLQKLDDKPHRFTELLSSMDVSRGTLSSRLKEGKEMGIFQKTIRPENGQPAWSLTDQGKAESKQLKVDRFNETMAGLARSKKETES